MTRKKILIVGYGNIGKCFGQNLSDEFRISIVSPNSRPDNPKFEYFSSLSQINGMFDYIIFCVKPQVILTVLDELFNLNNKIYTTDTVFISTLAGTKTELFKQKLGQNIKIARIMPNLAIKIKAGLIAVFYHEELPFLNNFGKVIYLKDEGEMHAFTAVCGSGIGFVFNLMEIFENIAKSHNLPDAKNLVYKHSSEHARFRMPCRTQRSNPSKPALQAKVARRKPD